MTARATYLAGTWVAIAAPDAWLLVDVPPEHELVTRCWSLLSGGAAIDDVLDALVAAGIRSAPSFAIARTSSDEHRVVVRGDVRVVVDGEREIAAPSARTWADEDAPDGATLTLITGGPVAGHPLPMGSGVTMAASIRVEPSDRSVAAPAPEPAPEREPAPEPEPAPSYDFLFGATRRPPRRGAGDRADRRPRRARPALAGSSGCGLTRSVYSARANGSAVTVSDVIVSFADPSDAQALVQLDTENDTGDVNTLIDDGESYPGSPSSWTTDPTFYAHVDAAGDVEVLEAMWSDTAIPTHENNPTLYRLLTGIADYVTG